MKKIYSLAIAVGILAGSAGLVFAQTKCIYNYGGSCQTPLFDDTDPIHAARAGRFYMNGMAAFVTGTDDYPTINAAVQAGAFYLDGRQVASLYPLTFATSTDTSNSVPAASGVVNVPVQTPVVQPTIISPQITFTPSIEQVPIMSTTTPELGQINVYKVVRPQDGTTCFIAIAKSDNSWKFSCTYVPQ